MATYSDPVVSIQTGTRTTTGTVYTCPTGKFAQVNVRITQIGSSTLTIDGALIIPSTDGSTTVFLNASQTIQLTVATSATATFTAFEYAAP